MAHRYIIATKVEKLDPENPEATPKVYYKYIGDQEYSFNRSVVLDSTQTRILKGFQEIYRHGCRSLKDAEELLESRKEADQEFTDDGRYRKTSKLLSFYFVPRY